MKVDVYTHCSTCVYASQLQTACFYWKAQEGDLSDKMVCIVCSINMPTFLNLPSCKRCWRLKQATHYSCMRAFRALFVQCVGLFPFFTVSVFLRVACNSFIEHPGVFSHGGYHGREKMSLTELLRMIKSNQPAGFPAPTSHKLFHNKVRSQLFLRVCLVSNPSNSGLSGIKSECQTAEAPCRDGKSWKRKWGMKRFSLIGWTDAERKGEKEKEQWERGRGRKTTQGKSALSTHKQIHHQLWQTTRRITMSLSAQSKRRGGCVRGKQGKMQGKDCRKKHKVYVQ